jgi:pimeloyl-ACP methyl ester carboxylesterase
MMIWEIRPMTDFAFLHGGGQGSWVWYETIAAMNAQSGSAHRYLALDAPGCGCKRDRDTSAISFDGIVAEIVADVRNAGFADVVLVGHSQAGTVLPRMAASAPELFRRLVHVSTIAPDPGADVIEMSARRMTDDRSEAVNRSFFDEAMPAAERFGLKFCNDMNPAQASQFLAKLGHDNWPRSSYEVSDWNYDIRSAHPVSYVLCLRDAVLTLPWQERFAERFGVTSLPRIDAGHQAMNSRPQALAEILLAEASI